MARFLADEDFDHNIVRALRALGHDVSTVQDAGLANRQTPDDEILAFATSEERAVLTHNRKDFVRLHGRSPAHGEGPAQRRFYGSPRVPAVRRCLRVGVAADRHDLDARIWSSAESLPLCPAAPPPLKPRL
jgi:hypothetical protein